MESEVLANLESQFGEVKNKILVAVKESCNIHLFDKELETLKHFLMITFARNPWFAKQLRKSRIFDFGLSIEDYSIVTTNFSYHVFEEHFSDFYLSLFINKTKIRLVIPQNVIFVAPDKRCLLFVLPISPNIAILFGQLKNIDNCFVCKSEGTILRFNEAAVQQELNAPKDKSFKHIYAQDCSELEVAKRYINN